MSKFIIIKQFINKLYRYIEWGWKGITVFIYFDITKEPKKFKFNFYSIFFPFFILIILIIFLLYDRIETRFRDQNILVNYQKQQSLIYNFYYALQLREKNLNNIVKNLNKIYIKKLSRLLVEEHFFSKKEQMISGSSTKITKIEEELLKSIYLKNKIQYELKIKPMFLLQQLWHMSHIYSVIPKGIPMYPGTYTITSVFGNRQDPFHQEEGDFHSGIDFASAQNTPILAPTEGMVIKVYKNLDTGYGYHIIIHHGLGFQTLYAHCNEIFVQENEFVKEFQVIGLVGKTGRATGNHLHYEVRIGANLTVDPLPFIQIK